MGLACDTFVENYVTALDRPFLTIFIVLSRAGTIYQYIARRCWSICPLIPLVPYSDTDTFRNWTGTFCSYLKISSGAFNTFNFATPKISRAKKVK